MAVGQLFTVARVGDLPPSSARVVRETFEVVVEDGEVKVVL